MELPSTDPWAIAARPEPGPWPVRFAPPLAVVLGAVGPFLAVHDDGPAGRQGAWLLLALAILVELAVVALHGRRYPVAAVAAVAAVAPALAAQARIGRAPVLVVVLAVVVADLALSDRWRTWRRGAAAAPVTAGAAVAALALAQVQWVRHTSNAVTLGLLVVAAALALARHAGPIAAVGRGLAVAGAHLATWLGHLVVLVVALPTLYLVGGVAALARRLTGHRVRWDDPRTTWAARRTTASDERKDAPHPFASTPAKVRRDRTLVGLGLVALVVVGTVVAVHVRRSGGGSGSVVSRRDAAVAAGSPTASTTRPAQSTSQLDAIEAVYRVPYSDRPAYAGKDFADGLQDEILALDFQPSAVGSYGLRDAKGSYVNITDGVRHTIGPTCDCPRAVLWLAGGSGAFGYGQRDDHTIASELVRLAAEDGIALDVVNLGVPGWTLWQEYQSVAARLAGDAPAPDVVAFYDGYNDAMATMLDVAKTGSVPEAPAVMADVDWQAVLGKGPSIVDQAGGADALATDVADRYDALRKVAAETVTGSGAAVGFFWQPDALASPRQRAAVEPLYAKTGLPKQFTGLDAVLRKATGQLEPDVVDLRDVFDDVREPLFIDSIHPNEDGGKLVAEAMYRDLRSEIRSRAR